MDSLEKPTPINGLAASPGSAIVAWNRIPDEVIRKLVADVRPQIAEWFLNNPKRKICKLDWFYGRSIDLRRRTFKARIDKEEARLLSEPNNLAEGAAPDSRST